MTVSRGRPEDGPLRTVSETWPIEIRAEAIAVFFAGHHRSTMELLSLHGIIPTG